MRVLIIETEFSSAEQLKDCISAVKKECSFLPFAASIQESMPIVSTMTPDVIFMNIDFSNSKGFNLFRKTTLMSPIVFTTAGDQMLTGSVQNGAILYLVKPYQQNRIEEALYYIEKSLKLRNLPTLIDSKVPADNHETHHFYKSRFLVRLGQKLIPVKTSEINHFASEGSLVYAATLDRRKYVIDESLNDLDILLNPSDFFRVNRKFIIAKDSILSLDYYSKGQVAVKANLLETERIVVSRQQTPVLKMWLSQ